MTSYFPPYRMKSFLIVLYCIILRSGGQNSLTAAQTLTTEIVPEAAEMIRNRARYRYIMPCSALLCPALPCPALLCTTLTLLFYFSAFHLSYPSFYTDVDYFFYDRFYLIMIISISILITRCIAWCVCVCVWFRANREMREERNMFINHRDDEDDNMQYTANVRSTQDL